MLKMFSKIKNIVSNTSVQFNRYLTPKINSNYQTSKYKHINIIYLKRKLIQNTKNIEKYKIKLNTINNDTNNTLMKYHTSIEYLYFYSNYLSKLHDKYTIKNSYEKLIKERTELCTQLRELGATNIYLQITKEYTKHIYD